MYTVLNTSRISVSFLEGFHLNFYFTFKLKRDLSLKLLVITQLIRLEVVWF